MTGEQAPPPTHQDILHSSAGCFQPLCGILHLLLDLWQQSLQLLHLLPLVWKTVGALGLV